MDGCTLNPMVKHQILISVIHKEIMNMDISFQGTI